MRNTASNGEYEEGTAVKVLYTRAGIEMERWKLETEKGLCTVEKKLQKK